MRNRDLGRGAHGRRRPRHAAHLRTMGVSRQALRAMSDPRHCTLTESMTSAQTSFFRKQFFI